MFKISEVSREKKKKKKKAKKTKKSVFFLKFEKKPLFFFSLLNVYRVFS